MSNVLWCKASRSHPWEGAKAAISAPTWPWEPVSKSFMVGIFLQLSLHCFLLNATCQQKERLLASLSMHGSCNQRWD